MSDDPGAIDRPRPLNAWDLLKDEEKAGVVMGPLGFLMLPIPITVWRDYVEEPVLRIALTGLMVLVAVCLIFWGGFMLYKYVRWRSVLSESARRTELRAATVTEHVWIYSTGTGTVTSDNLTGRIRWIDQEGNVGMSHRAYPKPVVLDHPIGQTIEVCEIEYGKRRSGTFWAAEL
ncbi:MAG: hypothetical protein AAFQ66_11060 [Pseudomonadota bacterium]